jgi:hypothetical protein
MKIVITENQFKNILESYWDGVIKILKLYTDDGFVMVEYKSKDGEIYNDDYEEIMDDLDPMNKRSFINKTISYIEKNDLNLENSNVLKKLVKLYPQYFEEFCYEPSGKPLPCRYSSQFSECDEECLEDINKVINLVWNYEYPMKVYRGLRKEEQIDSEYMGMHWTLNKNVAESFGEGGKYVYVGIIENKENVHLGSTIEHQLMYPGEHEINGKIKIIDKYINPYWE